MKKPPGDDESDKLRARPMSHERSLRRTVRGDNKWISIADATDFLGTPDAAGLIERAWKLRTIRLRGVRPGRNRVGRDSRQRNWQTGLRCFAYRRQTLHRVSSGDDSVG
jgi:hypothetical protein